ncbi:hypothetical protein DRO02_05980 [archaeon]|nr:MAG: hypothetical protein DRO02_05980 [archaeon]
MYGEDKYRILGNIVRKRIIELLGEHGELGVKELKELLGIGTGTLYFHLKELSDYIEKTPERKYRLSRKGLALYYELRGIPAPTAATLLDKFTFVTFSFKFLRLGMCIVCAAIVVIMLIALSYASRVGLFLFLPLSFRSSWTAVVISLQSYLILLLATMILLKSGGCKQYRETSLLISSTTFIPMIIFIALMDALSLLGFGIKVAYMATAVFQVWCLAIYVNSCRSLCGIPAVKSVTLILVMLYISLFYAISMILAHVPLL